MPGSLPPTLEAVDVRGDGSNGISGGCLEAGLSRVPHFGWVLLWRLETELGSVVIKTGLRSFETHAFPVLATVLNLKA